MAQANSEQLAVKDQQIAELQKQLEAMAQANSEQLAVKDQQIAELQKQLEATDQRISRLEQVLMAKGKETNELHVKLDGVTKTLQHHKVESECMMANLQAKLEIAQKQFKELQLREFERELEKLKMCAVPGSHKKGKENLAVGSIAAPLPPTPSVQQEQQNFGNRDVTQSVGRKSNLGTIPKQRMELQLREHEHELKTLRKRVVRKSGKETPIIDSIAAPLPRTPSVQQEQQNFGNRDVTQSVSSKANLGTILKQRMELQLREHEHELKTLNKRIVRKSGKDTPIIDSIAPPLPPPPSFQQEQQNYKPTLETPNAVLQPICLNANEGRIIPARSNNLEIKCPPPQTQATFSALETGRSASSARRQNTPTGCEDRLSSDIEKHKQRLANARKNKRGAKPPFK